MDFNNFVYKDNNISKINARKRTISFVLSLIMTISLSGGTPELENKDGLIVKNKFNLENIIDLSGKMYTIFIKSNNKEFKNEYFLESLDFSEIPTFDGKVETSVNIARFIRASLCNIPNDFKLEFILRHFKMIFNEFDAIQAVIHVEAKAEVKEGNGDRYEDAFSVITSIYNRMRSKTKCGYAKLWLKKNDPISMYDHVISPLQYSPFGDNSYINYLGVNYGESYQAVLDALFSIALMEEGIIKENVIMHRYLDFLGNGKGYSYSIKFVPNGNEFAYYMEDSDIIPLEDRFYYEEKIICEEAKLSLS